MKKEKMLEIKVIGTKAQQFRAFRTDGKKEFYQEIGLYKPVNGIILYTATPGSVTTFFAE